MASRTSVSSRSRGSGGGGVGFKHNKPVQEFSNTGNFALDIKQREVCIGLKPTTQRLLLELSHEERKPSMGVCIWGRGSVLDNAFFPLSLTCFLRALDHPKNRACR